ncbi:peptidoglycan DD-metalloendopeptidase family protein [Kribbella sp. NPDC051770]|uniref:peptidoglycan DD-metalloendopeptidase family protein n=1 Tax=Kribbella sp. NPDC051770 TaxID=3155413 RepID=UPI00342EE33F
MTPLQPPPLADAIWPLTPQPRIVHPYTPPAKPWLPGHRGIDLEGTPGQKVLAATPGTITYAGPVAGRSVVVITRGPHRTTYEPVIPSLPRGTQVTQGQPIGTLSAAASHCTPTTCLHWGLLEGKTYLNPLQLLPTHPVRLLPTTQPQPRAAHPAELPKSSPPAPRPQPQPTCPPACQQPQPNAARPLPPNAASPLPTTSPPRSRPDPTTSFPPAQRPQPQTTCPPACQQPQPNAAWLLPPNAVPPLPTTPRPGTPPTPTTEKPTREANPLAPTLLVTLTALLTITAAALIRNH